MDYWSCWFTYWRKKDDEKVGILKNGTLFNFSKCSTIGKTSSPFTN
ncbi:MAG TPA: hypothetical protein VF242_05350 [Nitrososphaeraceae archaeon]|jgi:hypothetical protein